MSVRALGGVKVLDVTRIVSGPLACQFLAALGADVIRIEPPGGDHTWRTPPFVGPDGAHPGPRGPDDIPLAPLRRGRGINLDRAIYAYFAGQLLALPVLPFLNRMNFAMQTVICRRPR